MNVVYHGDEIVDLCVSNIKGLKYIPKFRNLAYNDIDGTFRKLKIFPVQETSDCNLECLRNILNKITVKNVIEIGVARNKERSFSHILIERKTGIYCGVDIEDKSFLNDELNRVYTLQSDSHNQSKVRNYFKQIGLKSVNVLLIDGLHSVNTVINDWLYTDLLDSDGIVILHDTNYHPGPSLLLDAIDKSEYRIEKYCDFYGDNGIAAAYKL